jgi:bile acid:Na+ symporter, BASS family
MKFLESNYTIIILIIAVIAYNFPEYFVALNGYSLNSFIKPVLQLIMLGMGITMSFSDFKEILITPKKVLIGLICQFSIMPVLGLLVTLVFNFPPEIAAGFILIGCSPSGMASNVMTLIAKGNLPLSITITACATLLAPLMTPFLMNLLIGELIHIDFLKMFFDMTQLVVFPIVLGLLINKFLPQVANKIKPLLPALSMIGIAYIVLVVTANGAGTLKTVGLLLLLAIFLQNVFGYGLGYLGAKLMKMTENDCRTVAIEVGMQNGGLASALANEMGKIATLGIVPALFSPLMNITGSLLASYWAKSSLKNE